MCSSVSRLLLFFASVTSVFEVDGIYVVQSENSANLRDVILPGCDNFTRGSWPDHVIYSPNYPNSYYNDTECIRVIEAPKGFKIELDFRNTFNIEEDYSCSYDYLEVRDGPYGFSRLKDRFCGKKYPPLIKSSSRFLWLRFVSDDTIERSGFMAVYNFVPDKAAVIEPTLFNETQFLFQIDAHEMDGMISTPDDFPLEIQRILNATELDQAFDITWDILAPANHKIRLFFYNFLFEAGGDCENNFVEIYDGTTVKSHLLQKICHSERVPRFLSTKNRLFLRVRAASKYKLALFEVLYTFITTAPCGEGQFSCGDNTCINESLVCNGRRDCDLVYDESRCIKLIPATPQSIERANINYIILGCVGGVLGTIVFISCIVTLHHKCKHFNDPQLEPDVVEATEGTGRRNSVDMKLLMNGHANTMGLNGETSSPSRRTRGTDSRRSDNQNPPDSRYVTGYGGFRTRVVGNGGVPSKAHSHEEMTRSCDAENSDMLLPPPDQFKGTSSDSSLYLSIHRNNGHIPVNVTIETPKHNPSMGDSFDSVELEESSGGRLETGEQHRVRFATDRKTKEVLRRIASERQSGPRERMDNKERPSSTGSHSPRPDVVQEEIRSSQQRESPETSPLLKRSKHSLCGNLQNNNTQALTPEILATIPRGEVYHLSV